MQEIMSLEHSEQEEGPGAFLSLSGGQGSSSPFRGPLATDSSPRVLVKQEQGDLETYLSLQQPNQESPYQLVHAQESPRDHTLGPAEAVNCEESLNRQNKAISIEQTRPTQPLEHKVIEPSENEKSSPSGSTEPSSSEQEKQKSAYTGHESLAPVQPLPEQQKPTAHWLTFVEQQTSPTCLGNSQQQRSGHSGNMKDITPFGSLNSSLHDISGENPTKNSSPLQVCPKQDKATEEEKLISSTGDEHLPPFQPSLEHHALFLHRPGLSSAQSEEVRDLPPLVQEQKISKGLPTEQFSLTLSQDCSQQQQVSPRQQWHKSAFIQAHMQQGSTDQPKDDSGQGPSIERKAEFMHEFSIQQTDFGTERMPRSQAVSHCSTIPPKQVFMPQNISSPSHNKTGVFCIKPSTLPNHIHQSGFVRDKELKLSMESPFARLASSQGAEGNYPFPMATHEAVFVDKRLFMETLQSLHAALNQHLNMPKVEGGIEVDLHKLYKEVTCRGGLELVMNGRKWQDIAGAFGFFSNLMNASSMLERTYISTLHHYEQVYFRRASDRIVPPPAVLSSQSPGLPDQKEGGGLYERELGSAITNGTTDSAQALGVDPASSVGAVVSGAIDGKFDDGYLVTVMVGARKLRGILYHVSSTDTPFQSASMPSMMQSINSGVQLADVAPKIGRKRKKREVFRKDPNAPRQNRTGYNFFFAEQRAKLKTMQPDKDRAISKMIGELWSKLSEDERTPYQVKGVKDKERYVREMKEYKEKSKLPMMGSNELQTIPPLHSQLPCTNIPRPHHDPKSRSSVFASSYMPEGSGNVKGVSPQLHSAAVSEPADTLMVAQSQLPEAPKVSEAALLHFDRDRTRTADEPEVTMDSTNCSSVAVSQPTTVNTTSLPTVVSTIGFSASDLSVTSTVDMAKFLIDEASPKGFLPSERQNQAGLNHSEMEEHVSAMEE